MRALERETEPGIATAVVTPLAEEAGGSAGPRTYALVACVSAASLGLELIHTRVLSFLYYNHVVYLTVTIALLGFGISGVFVSLFASRFQNAERAIAFLAAAFAVSSFLCIGVVSRIPGWFPHAPTTVKLVASYLLLTLPFLFSGGVLGWIFMIHAKSISRMYAVDLACSSGAVLVFLLLLWPLGGSRFVWACSAMALLGFWVFSRGKVSRAWRFAVTAACAGVILLFGNNLLGNKPEPYKTLFQVFERPGHSTKIETTQWTPITRIDVWSDSLRDAVFGNPTPDALDSRIITQDADAPTVLLGPHHVAWTLEAARRHEVIGALSLLYRLNPEPADALVIGVGGGRDILMARAYGAKNITGAEINEATVALDRGPYRNFLLWPDWDGVKLVRTEGRNYLRSKAGSYDTVVMSGVDTFAALNSGAYVLSENYLYTVEAVQDYLNSLKPGGTMAIYRWFFHQHPRESIRLASLFLSAADRMAIPHPEQRIMVVSEIPGFSTYRWAATFIKKEPFTAAEVKDIAAAIANDPRLSIVYMPKVFDPAEQAAMEQKEAALDAELTFARAAYNRLLAASPADRAAFIQSYDYRIDPVYDDRPFFFEYYKPGAEPATSSTFGAQVRSIRGPAGYYVPYILLAVCGIVCAGCILIPLYAFQRRGLEVSGVFPLLLFFACLGSGYMMFEVGAMQVLNVYLGDPAYSLAIVLAGLLVASGAGAALSWRFQRLAAVRVISLATGFIAAAIPVWLGIVHWLHPATMRLPLTVRAAIVVAGLFPVGLLLGLPFPTAVKRLEGVYPSFIAWAWGVNGVTSVLASIVAIVVAMKAGFSMVILAAAAMYVLAFVSYRWHSRALA